MQKPSKLLLGMLVGASLLAPLYVFAVGIPFGGLITGETPCHIGPAPALWINVLGFSFIDVLGTTIPYPLYAPVIGEFILGQADVPLTCFVGTIPLPPGLRIQMFGNSAL